MTVRSGELVRVQVTKDRVKNESVYRHEIGLCLGADMTLAYQDDPDEKERWEFSEDEFFWILFPSGKQSVHFSMIEVLS